MGLSSPRCCASLVVTRPVVPLNGWRLASQVSRDSSAHPRLRSRGPPALGGCFALLVGSIGTTATARWRRPDRPSISCDPTFQIVSFASQSAANRRHDRLYCAADKLILLRKVPTAITSAGTLFWSACLSLAAACDPSRTRRTANVTSSRREN